MKNNPSQPATPTKGSTTATPSPPTSSPKTLDEVMRQDPKAKIVGARLPPKKKG